jgi:hypothetical protein
VVRARPFELIVRRPFLRHIREDEQVEECPLVGRYREVVHEPQGAREQASRFGALRVPLVVIHWVLQGAHCEWIAWRRHVANGEG